MSRLCCMQALSNAIDAPATHRLGGRPGSAFDKSSPVLFVGAVRARIVLDRTHPYGVNHHHGSNTPVLQGFRDFAGAFNSEDEVLYVPTRHKVARRNTIATALTIFNVAVSLATIIFWLSSSRHDVCFPRLAGAGEVQDAIDAHAIEYEVRSYSKPLEYDEASRKAVIASNGDRNYAGPPSLDTDAAWDDLLRGEFPISSWCLSQTKSP